jgi:hypothetical protein
MNRPGFEEILYDAETGACKSHMSAGGGYKKGVRVPYHVCWKRFNDREAVVTEGRREADPGG